MKPHFDGCRQCLQNLSYHVRGGYEVDIVASLLLEMNHDVRKFLGRHPLSLTTVADIVVLAKYAVEITVGKEDGPRSSSPHQWSFFSEVGSETRHYRVPCTPTMSLFSREAVHLAHPGTQGASLQPAETPQDLVFQTTGPICFKVSRSHK
jgi:hypothetical protein